MKKIIDVSEFQGVINWELVKSQIDGAILRCGYGMNQPEQDDAQFKRNANECTRLRIPFGVYLYSYADTSNRAESEADHVLRLIKGYQLLYPVYYDLEENSIRQTAAACARVLGNKIEKAGYWCGIYANLDWWQNDLTELNQFTKWVAQHGSKSAYIDDGVDMWQYTASGRITGIAGSVDLNECYRDFPAEMKAANNQKDQEVEEVVLNVLSKGDTGSQVRALQILLIGNGYDCGGFGADGTFGSGTETSVRAYQGAKGLRVDGIVGNRTWASLLGV